MKIICVGRNYSEHAKELNNAIPSEPVIFLKPDTALLHNNSDFYYPSFTKNIHYECELVVKINKVGKNIEEKFAHRYYSEIALGIDFTARDLQDELKAKGLPWERAKAFDHSAAIGTFVSIEHLSNKENITFDFFKNGEKVQTGESKQMLFSIDQIVAFVSKYFTLKVGDLIFSGTPSGVGPIQINDIFTGNLEGKENLKIAIK